MTATPAIARDQTTLRRALLHEAVEPLARELRLVEPVDLLAFVACGQLANLDDLVQSSLELAFKPDAFAFGWAADVFVSWEEPPAVALEMEFSSAGITMFFVLRIAARRHDVDIRCVSFADVAADPDANTRALADALRGARVGNRQASDKPLRP